MQGNTQKIQNMEDLSITRNDMISLTFDVTFKVAISIMAWSFENCSLLRKKNFRGVTI